MERWMLLLTNLILLVHISLAIKCYNGYSQKDNPMGMSVRQVDCPKELDRCISIKYSTTFLGTQLNTTQGNCGSAYSETQCKVMEHQFKTMTSCKLSTCSTDYCNDAVAIAAEEEKKKHAGTGRKLKCYTGQIFQIPKKFPNTAIPIKLDECFAASKQCITVNYKMLLRLDKYKITIPTIQGMCADPRVPCDKFCSIMEKYFSSSDCKASCCSTDGCNRNLLPPTEQTPVVYHKDY